MKYLKDFLILSTTLFNPLSMVVVAVLWKYMLAVLRGDMLAVLREYMLAAVLEGAETLPGNQLVLLHRMFR
ncbi:hypothetical protein [Salinisphaera sp. G21_0]|uniref:hypothetical protein n=1 Tax=Salinisphaera sp. G21_0 TaxID=2821094 RepID=UPI001ADA4C99|nr:hypothetical protein [Salinisphaera sp. G21_0]MBO9482611.1 hypothetical protein [Salinisphaera sp. G21_0]